MVHYDSIILIIKALVAGIVFIGIIGFVIRPLIKGLTTSLGDPDQGITRHTKEIAPDEEIEIPTTGESQATHESIIKTAREDPIKTTMLVRNWLREKK